MKSNDADLLNILLSTTSLGEKLMSEWKSLGNLFHNLDAADLTPIQRRKLEAALQIHFVREDGPDAMSPANVFELVKDLQKEPQEHLVVLVFDRRTRMIHRENLYKGSVSSSQVRMGEILRPALIRRASAIVVCHNHPSGDPTPSPDDVAMTRALHQAAKLMDIELLDHIVVGAGKWVSLKERGLGFY